MHEGAAQIWSSSASFRVFTVEKDMHMQEMCNKEMHKGLYFLKLCGEQACQQADETLEIKCNQ